LIPWAVLVQLLTKSLEIVVLLLVQFTLQPILPTLLLLVLALVLVVVCLAILTKQLLNLSMPSLLVLTRKTTLQFAVNLLIPLLMTSTKILLA
jgi:hypothetical protein